METRLEKNFMVSPVLIWILVLANYLMAINFAFSFPIFSESVFILGFMCCLLIITWMIFLADVLGNKIYHKSFWIIVLFFTPLIAYPFYLIQRRKHLNMARKREKFIES